MIEDSFFQNYNNSSSNMFLSFISILSLILLLNKPLVAYKFHICKMIKVYRVERDIQMGFFDDIKLIFSEGGRKNIKEYNEKMKEEQLAIQREILERSNTVYPFEYYN
jgi:hypothetical protein